MNVTDEVLAAIEWMRKEINYHPTRVLDEARTYRMRVTAGELELDGDGRLTTYDYIRKMLERGLTHEECCADLLDAKLNGAEEDSMVYLTLRYIRNLTAPEHNDPTSVQAPDPVDPGVPG